MISEDKSEIIDYKNEENFGSDDEDDEIF